jgi:hypothetical protein
MWGVVNKEGYPQVARKIITRHEAKEREDERVSANSSAHNDNDAA